MNNPKDFNTNFGNVIEHDIIWEPMNMPSADLTIPTRTNFDSFPNPRIFPYQSEGFVGGLEEFVSRLDAILGNVFSVIDKIQSGALRFD